MVAEGHATHATHSTLEILFEGAPGLLLRCEPRDGESVADLLNRAEAIARSMPEQAQIELLNAHPRIGASPASVSAMSYAEQGYDTDPGTAELQARLDRLNAEYERRFGFRFCVFVAGRSRAEIADVMESHMDASRDAELDRALTDVFAIARDRAQKLEEGPQNR
jgi:2-oxo-4-hydroxy-4-carboxy--5-ureidoimidazoline (OHCU) decarboxylase